MKNTTNWKKLPGNFDSLHMEQTYPGWNRYNLPDLLPQPEDIQPPTNLFPLRFGQPVRTQRPLLVHFYTDDFRFESVWHQPYRAYQTALRHQVWGVCTPDFSLWLDYPLAAQIWNTYRNRWLGRNLQQMGAFVVPTVNWSSTSSFDFCFKGIPEHQIISLRTWQRVSALENELFLEGYSAMRKQLSPRLILWFGHVPKSIANDGVEKILFPVGWKMEEGDSIKDGGHHGR